MPTALHFSAQAFKSSGKHHHGNGDDGSSDSHVGKEPVQASHARIPSNYNLEEDGSIVKARYPFDGNPEMLQLSFNIGDKVMILRRDGRWSWGKLVKTGEVIILNYVIYNIAFMNIHQVFELYCEL